MGIQNYLAQQLDEGGDKGEFSLPFVGVGQDSSERVRSAHS
jgi:hypothetical protein